ncbi:MAG: hypothetical protein IKU21_06785, partial [Anaerotignum sp.]|nr:hypothetical protein [Anaerotignum sp.]
MRKKILSFILAASLALNGMPMMASASQIDPVSSSTETNEPEQTTVLISEWSWADEYEVIDTDSNTAFLPTIGSFDTVVSVLPAAILFDNGKDAAITEWKCDDFAEQAGTYTFAAALEEGYELEETAPALTLTVEMGQVEVQDTGDTENPHTHCICGGSQPSANNHICDTDQEWRPWDDRTKLPDDTSGSHYYYLTTDVTLNSTWYPKSNIFLCLHGHVIQGNDIRLTNNNNNTKTLTITDCEKTEHKFTADNSSGLWILDETNGDKTLKGGVITGGNYSNGGGISSSGTLHMYGGNIVGNTSTSDGGGIFVSAGTFYMYGGTITGNTAGNNGGGVYIKTGARFEMYDGT